MALSYGEIYDLNKNESLKKKAAVAVTVAATYVIAGGGSPTANMKAFAKQAMQNPEVGAQAFMWYIVANATVQSQGANVPDSVVQQVIDSNYATLWA